MAGSPPLKIFNPQGEYVASCKMYEDAAMLVGNYGPGAKIKYGAILVWTEGQEEFSASESFDGAREIMVARYQTKQREAFKKAYGYYPN